MAVLAPALVRARSELNQRWPNRDRRTDGWIGDTSHQASGMPENGGSDHNPNRRGVVDALDIDVDGIDCPLVVALLIKHPAVNYVIWNRTIWSRSHGFAARRYTGENPHVDHIHVSLLQLVAAENSTAPWGIAVGLVVVPVVYPTAGPADGPSSGWVERLARAMPSLRTSPIARGSVRKLQTLLDLDGAHLGVDGVFGPNTAAAVRAFQVGHGLAVDGIAGPNTWTALLTGLTTLRSGYAKGTLVRRLQALVNLFGARIGVDGEFGPRTYAAVQAFQHRYGLGVDGVVGPITWTALLTR